MIGVIQVINVHEKIYELLIKWQRLSYNTGNEVFKLIT